MLNENVNAIVAEVFELNEDEVSGDLTPENVELWDSLNHLRLITAIEEEFNIKLSMDEIESIANVSRLIELVQQHTQQT